MVRLLQQKLLLKLNIMVHVLSLLLLLLTLPLLKGRCVRFQGRAATTACEVLENFYRLFRELLPTRIPHGPPNSAPNLHSLKK